MFHHPTEFSKCSPIFSEASNLKHLQTAGVWVVLIKKNLKCYQKSKEKQPNRLSLKQRLAKVNKVKKTFWVH